MSMSISISMRSASCAEDIADAIARAILFGEVEGPVVDDREAI